MVGYIGTKAVNLSTTGADINGNANVDGTLDVSGAATFSGPFTSLGIDDNATSTAITIDAAGHVGIGAAASVYNFEVSDTDGNGMVYRDLTNGVATWMGGYLSAGMTGTLTNHPYTLWANNAERVRIGETGNVSIGGTPSSWGGAVKALELDGQAADYLAFNSGVSGYLYQNVYFNGTNNLRKNDGFASAYGNVLGEHLFFTGPTGASGTAVTLNERMRIDNSGNVLVGTTIANGTLVSAANANAYALYVNGSSIGYNIACRGLTGTGTAVRFLNSAGADVGSIDYTATATAYTTTSDPRLKENITPIQGATDILRALNPVTYTFKADGSWMDGFLTTEVQTFLPSAVTGEPDAMMDEEYEVTPAVLDAEGTVVTEAVTGTRSVPDYQGMDYSRLTPILTAALQEALNKIDELTARIETLEAK
jgi:hypothetical protein